VVSRAELDATAMPSREENIPFGNLVETLLDRAVASGLKLPIVVVLVAVNGYIRAVRYAKDCDEWESSELVTGSEPPGWYPLNLIFCDAEGQSLVARVNDSSGLPTMIQ
jgi:hypothetical protein